MSSTYISGRKGPSGPACMAVNGKTGTVFRSLTDDDPNCVLTADTDNGVDDWWQVDLGSDHIVTNITIYRRAGYQLRMSGIQVEVDNQTCHSFPLMADDEMALVVLPEKIEVTCTPPLTGRVVRLQKRGQPWNYGYGAQIINVCEVQVWGCRAGFYGAECVEPCGQCADGDTCSAVSGHCPQGCQTGWQGDNCKQMCDAGKYGNHCSSSCGHCYHSDVCHLINGVCPRGCEAGFDPSDPLCEKSCPEGTYGPDCQTDCGNCLNSAACKATTGVCPGSCEPGWTNQYCTEVCDAGKYGSHCSSSCGHCNHGDVCHHIHGICPRGCEAGFDPSDPLCEEVCQNGRHGDNCSEQCGQCSGGDQCNPVNGTCASCQPQFKPPWCKVCTGKSYGASCDLNCSTQCGGDGSCEQDSGRCVDGCAAGYRPGQSGFCNDVCEEGKYGEGCSMECGKCTHSCRHDDGLCIGGCFDGFAGPYCAKTSESSFNFASPLLVGAVFGGTYVIALSILLVGVLVRRPRKCSSSETARPSPTSAYPSFEPDAAVGLSGHVSLQDETGSAYVTEAEESHIYDELQTPDDSDRDLYLTPVVKGKQGKARQLSHLPKPRSAH